MFRLTHLVRIAALAAGVALGAPAGAATLTLDMPLCNSFTLNGGTLTCETGTLPTCQIAGPTSGTLGTPVALTATCTNGPITGYTWLGCTTSNGATCTLNPATAATYPVTVAGTNATGTGAPTAPYNVVFSATPPNPPSGCTLNAVPNPVTTMGGTTNLSVSCSGGGAPTNWVWSGAGVVNVNAAATTAVVTSTTTYSVIVSNAGGSTTPTRQVTLNTGGGGGSCGTFTVQDSGAIDFSTTTSEHIDLGKGDRDVHVFSYTAQAADVGRITHFSVAEHGSGAHYYTVWASKTRCEMISQTQKASSSAGINIWLSVQNGQSVNMQVGETWYFMVRNWRASNQSNSCSDTTCGTLVSKYIWQ